MLEHKVISMRHPDEFIDLVVERKIEYTLTHNGNPVEIKKSSMADLPDHPGLKDWNIAKAETFVTFEGNSAYRGLATRKSRQDPEKTHEMLFYIEKVF